MEAGQSALVYPLLLRAADLSLLVNERTLGPDLDMKKMEINHLPRNTPKKDQITQNHSKIITQLERTYIAPQIGSARFLDYETIKLSVALRCEKQKCREAIRNELLEEHARETAFLQKKREERQRAAQEAHEKLLLKRKLDEQAISKKAEEHALQGEQKDQREIDAIQIQTRRTLRLVVFNGISQCQEIFHEKYSAVIKLLLACQRTDYNKCLKDLIEQFEQLIAKLKNNDYGSPELRTAQRICEALEALELKIIAEIEEIIQETERQREAELQQQQLNAQMLKVVEEEKAEPKVETNKQIVAPEITIKTPQNTEPTPTLAPENKVPTETIDDGFNTYTKIIAYYQSIVDKVKPLKNDESFKKYRFACQKSINTPINAISAVSPQHLQDKFEKLYGFINGQPANDVRTTDHPLGREYCLLLMAKKFVSQGTTTVSSNQQAAFPIASILVSLWKLIPELGQLFLAYLYKESPYMVPCFLKQQPGQSDEDFLKQLGYHITNGQMEPSEMYLKRQAGIARLYAAIIVTSGRQMDGPIHPHGLNNGWHWLTKIVSMEPLPDLSATIIMEFLQIIGAPMLRCYGKQFIKLLVFIQRGYFPQLAAIDKGGPKARLELQLNKFLQEGRIELPVGTLPAGYW